MILGSLRQIHGCIGRMWEGWMNILNSPALESDNVFGDQPLHLFRETMGGYPKYHGISKNDQ